MNVRFFADSISDEDIPLAKDYLRLAPDLNELCVVKKIVVISKGIMLINDKYKGTVWKNAAAFQELYEALEQLTSFVDEAPTFVTKIERTGQICVGVDDDLQGQGVWIKDSDTTYSFKQKKDVTTNVRPMNRFLAASQKSLLLARETEKPDTSTATHTKQAKKTS